MGVSIQPEGDKITIKADTFHLATENLFINKIYNRPDSLLLGTFVDKKYGTIHADILARVEAPFDSTGFRFPTNEVELKADSAFLVLSYRSWFGAANSTMSVKAYEMNKNKSLDYYTYYPTDINPDDYLDYANLLGDTIFTANDSSSNIRIRLSDEFTNRLFENSRDFADADDFFAKFNGLYITSGIGDATMMYLRSVNMVMHYQYKTKIADRDTIFTNSTNYVVNNVVVNRFLHPDADMIKEKLEQNDSINYVSSPANIYTQVNVPLRKIIEHMQNSIGEDKSLAVNSATIRVEAKDTDNKATASDSDITLPLPVNMLLMKKEDMDSFFTQERLPIDSIVYASYNSTDSCYTFNIASYIEREIRRAPKDENGKILISSELEEMEMVLVPVRITASTDYSGNTTISSVKQQVLMSGVAIRSGKDPNRPMKINLLYSGF